MSGVNIWSVELTRNRTFYLQHTTCEYTSYIARFVNCVRRVGIFCSVNSRYRFQFQNGMIKYTGKGLNHKVTMYRVDDKIEMLGYFGPIN